MKLIFMGTPEFALPSLHALLESDHDIVAVYTQPPRPAGRGKAVRKSPVHELAEQHKIAVHHPESLKGADVQTEFAAYQADAAVVVAYGLLLPKAILDGTKRGCINVHPSLLPRWRGAAPIERPIMAGDSMTGIGIMQMEEGLDTGPIFAEVQVPIPPDANAGMMHEALSQLGAGLLVRTLDALDKTDITPTPQLDDGMTYANKIQKYEAKIDWSKNVVEVNNLIRGMSPKPGAFFEYEGEKYKIIQANYAKISHDFELGTTLNDQLHIACEGGILHPTIVQRQGKKPMNIDTFLNGNAIPAGTQLN